MFIIFDTRNENPVVRWGPKIWEKAEIQDILYKKYDINYTVPYQNPTDKVYEVMDGVRILPARERSKPEYDILTQTIIGPFYEEADNIVYEYYTVEEMTLEESKKYFKERFTNRRNSMTINEFIDVEISNGNFTFYVDNNSINTISNGIPGMWKMQKITKLDSEALKQMEEEGQFVDPDIQGYETTKSWVYVSQEDLDKILAKQKNLKQLMFTMEYAVNKYVDEVAQSVDDLRNIPTRAIDMLEWINANNLTESPLSL
jgi:hypothetical protein